MIRALDLNADLGEGFGAYSLGDDAGLMRIVTSANVACGFHAGDPVVMRRTLRLARDNGVRVGAHPSFPDLQGFGRRPMRMAPAEVEAMVCYQIGALLGLARAEGMTVDHVKPHGALGNMAAADPDLAEAVAGAVRAVDPDLVLLSPAASALSAAGRRHGLRVGEEIFADRAYGDDGQLLPRALDGAMIHDPDASLAQVLRFLEAGGLVTRGGAHIPTAIHSVCVHGDTPRSLAIAGAVRDGLERHGLRVAALREVVAG